MIRAVLRPHRDTPLPAVRLLACELARTARGLRLRYGLAGNIAALRLPAPAGPRRADRLWEHSCLEVFIAAGGQPGYVEFNFAPSGAWAAYAFRGYREPVPAPEVEPWIEASVMTDRLELQADIDLALLSLADMPLEVGLAAVLEDGDGRLSYWALRHAAGKPDFHRRENFALTLPPGTDMTT